MASDPQKTEQLYRVRLKSGRELGPLGLDRIQKLIRKKHITGEEEVRILPSKEWVAWNSVAELSALVSHAKGTSALDEEPEGDPAEEKTIILDEGLLNGTEEEEATRLISELDLSPAAEAGPDLVAVSPVEKNVERSVEAISAPGPTAAEKTVVLNREDVAQVLAADSQWGAAPPKPGIKKPSPAWFQKFKLAVILMGAFAAAYEFFNPAPVPKAPFRLVLIDPCEPKIREQQNPEESLKVYAEAFKSYMSDHIEGYRKALKLACKSAELDKNNVRAHAILLSAHLNLVEVSKRDEQYAGTVFRLLQRMRAINVSILETLIAEVEFFIFTGKPEAASLRIKEFASVSSIGNPNFAKLNNYLHFLSGLASERKGAFHEAATFLANIPDSEVKTPRIFYLRGMVAEAVGQNDFAISEYKKAIQLESSHGKSRLRIAELYLKRAEYGEASPHLDFLSKQEELLTPKEIARVAFLDSRVNLNFERTEAALKLVEKAKKFDPNSREYILEAYRQRARTKDPTPRMQREARMFLAVIEAEKSLKEGEVEKAKAKLIEASSVNPESEIPFVELGDLFRAQGEVGLAKSNFKIAAEKAKDNVSIWSKYIGTLIETFEFAEADKAILKFKTLSAGQSAIDKAEGDKYLKMDKPQLAQEFYRKAMSRESVEPDVYISYAQSLLETRNFNEAPFYFQMALRLDPLNIQAVVGIAKAIANTEGATGGYEKAIEYLQEHLSRHSGARAELFTAMAEFEIARGELKYAQDRLDEAFAANPAYPAPWKVQGDLLKKHYELLPREKKREKQEAIEGALEAYKSFSARTPSDPTGYLARFMILRGFGKFKEAEEELALVYAVNPNYPMLHHYFGMLYSDQGDHVGAVKAYQKELANFPGRLVSLVKLGESLIKTGAFSEAQRILSEAMQRDPRRTEAKVLAGDLAMAQKKISVAVTLYRAATLLDPGNSDIFQKLGDAYLAMGDRANADEAFRKARQQRGE
jgi:tetratricopeptide (TPR) repeat protein